jgi:nucleotide-binding universal stress UspA family protein
MTAPDPLREVLCGTAFDDGDERAFAHALRIVVGAGGRLRQVHLGDRPRDGGPEWGDYPRVRETLQRWGLSLDGMAVEKVLAATPGDVAEGLLFASRLQPTDLIVLATSARSGVARLVHGSVAESVLEGTHSTPILLLPPGAGFVDPASGRIQMRHVLAPVASPPGYRPLLLQCQRLMLSLGVSGVSGRVLHFEGSGGGLDGSTLPAGPIEWELSVRSTAGDVEETLLEEIRKTSPDLVVMTTAGPHGLTGLLRGSVTERILRQASCPVLALARH